MHSARDPDSPLAQHRISKGKAAKAERFCDCGLEPWIVVCSFSSPHRKDIELRHSSTTDGAKPSKLGCQCS